MAATATVTNTIPLDDTNYLYIGTIALDASYPTGGEAINPAGNERFEVLIGLPGGTTASGAGYKPEWNAAGQLLLMFYNDYDAVADGASIQVPDTTDLVAITALPFIAIGQ